MRAKLTEAQARFLCRFVARGWIHGTRECADEQKAIHAGIKLRWLRRELSEVHFTPAGRLALQTAGGEQPSVTEDRANG